MSQKVMKVVVELNLRAVTCPGERLQAKDDIYLSVCLMNQYRQSQCLPAVFPLLFREKMRFEKVFWHATDPGALAEILECEIAKVELIQLTPPVGEALASFVEDVRSFLYPEPKLVPPTGGVDRAVLMSRGPAFMYADMQSPLRRRNLSPPALQRGISPRLEFSTRTVISECSASSGSFCTPVPLRVLTQKRRKKPKHGGLSSPERLSSSAPWRRGRQRGRDAASAGATRARSLSPSSAALLDGHSYSTHRQAELQLATQSPASSLSASSLSEATPDRVRQRNSEPWRGDGQSSPNTSRTGRTGRTRSPSPSLRLPRKPGTQTSGVIRRSRSSGGALDEDSSSSDTEDLLDYSADEDLGQSGMEKNGSPNPAALWRAYRKRPHLNGSLLCSPSVWEDVQTRLRSLLTSPKAIHRLAHGATDSEVDEVLVRRSISPHSGPA